MGKSNGSHEIENIDINPAVNGGFAARCRYKAKKSTSGKGEIASSYVEPDQLAFGSKDELLAWLSSNLAGGDVESESAGGALPAAGAASAAADDTGDEGA